ncbi:hypothetical protein TCAL_15822 [Tigriopus californicus]|uniref:CUB domain-containing protein n=1 Tax=Tigriopus californicus TaxID=6832 RepID=A0A553NP38_TIGCA|nr:hypothetical protein TCAL_15822 [Tigriopus californicus]
MADSEEIMGGMCVDSLKVTSSSNEPIPEICGQNSGQHIYVDMDRGCSGNTQLDFSFSGTASIRIFEIKASQIECGSRSAPPDGCLQYHTELDGRFQTFNYAAKDESHLDDQKYYSICIRQMLGYCCIQYSDLRRLVIRDHRQQFIQNTVVTNCSAPFEVRIFTNEISDVNNGLETKNTKVSKGLCFEYIQMPCQ